MGLLLSVLVVCVGVLEAISCVRHVRHGYLPSWVSARRPMLHERARNKPNDSSSDDDETANELSRILRNDGCTGVSSPSYGLTPILTEHRRNTPILRDDEERVDEPKYVPNNIDECYTGSRVVGDGNNVLAKRFRPISPSDLEDEPPLDESYVSETGKFLEVPPDGTSPLQRSSSEETLHDSECEDVRSSTSGLAEPPCPVEEQHVLDEGLDEVVFQIDRASPPGDGPPPVDNLTDDDDTDMTNDPVFSLVSAAAYILSNEANTLRKSPHGFGGGSTSSCRPLNVDVVTARIPTPQTHRESIPFDLVAAHASASSRPETPTTPLRSRADISWPVFHPEPVIKRPVIAHTDLPRGDSIEEDLDSIDGDLTDTGLATTSGELPSLPLSSDVVHGDSIEEDIDSVDGDLVAEESTDTGLAAIPGILPSLSSVDEVSHSTGQASTLPSPLDSSDVADPSEIVEPQYHKVDVPMVDEARGVEDQCSKVVARSLSAVPATPFMSIPGSACVSVAHRPRADDPLRPCRKTSVDRFGRITCEPCRKRRGSLERPAPEGTLKASGVMSKSLPDFFFEENKVDADESVSLGKDITPKESSIKRRRSYREKKRSNWTPSKSRGRDVTEPVSETEAELPQQESLKKSLFEIDNESMDDFTGGSTDSGKMEAIINNALTPVEVLYHSEVRPESGVFATPAQQPKTRLKRPVKAESFEEAGPNVLATPTPVKVEQTVGGHSKDTTTTTVGEGPPRLESNSGPAVGRITNKRSAPSTVPSRAPVPKQPDETKPNNDEDYEDDDVSASESDTSNINQPQQSSEPAPFWVRRCQ